MNNLVSQFKHLKGGRKMKRIGKNLLVLGLILAGVVGITACKKDEPDRKSVV